MQLDAKQWHRKFGSLRKNIGDLRPEFQKINLRMAKFVRNMYDNSTDPYDRKWKKRKHFYPWKIHVRTGHMRSSYSYRALRKGSNIRVKAKYSGHVQRGPRKILPTNDRLPNKWIKEFNRILITGINRRK